MTAGSRILNSSDRLNRADLMHKSWLAIVTATTLAAGTAHAANPTVTTTFKVAATVQPNCTTSATGLGFGTYTPGNGALAASSNITVNCTKSTAYTIALNPGSTTGDSFAQRLMASGANTLRYNLYTTAAFATVWGDGTGATATQAGTGAGMGTASTYKVYGQLPDSAVNQAAVPGSYTDTITVTVTY
jgi:spore coat protein U-like protein